MPPLRGCTGEGISPEHLQDDSLATSSSILSVLYEGHKYCFGLGLVCVCFGGGGLFILCSRHNVALWSLLFNYEQWNSSGTISQ